MKANNLPNRFKNDKGNILVFVSLAIVALLAAAALVIDFGFMYGNKAKLQNAADAGALAGAGRITPQLNLNNYTGARNGAVQIADANFTEANPKLNLSTNSNNSSGGDVVLGHWDKTATPPFNEAAPANQINAVKVVARRTGETGAGIGDNSKFNLFMGNIFGTKTMGTAASAIAYRPPRARTYIMASYSSVCYRPASEFPKTLTPANNSMAWTSLQNNATSDSGVRNDFFCPATKLPFDEVCGTTIYTTKGTDASVFDAVETDLYDPNYDRGMKTIDGSGNVTWKVIVPVSEPHVVATSTGSSDPKIVWGYAEMLITKACGQGNACGNGRSFNAPGGTCTNAYKKTITIQQPPTCYSCADSSSLRGAMPVLAK